MSSSPTEFSSSPSCTPFINTSDQFSLGPGNQLAELNWCGCQLDQPQHNPIVCCLSPRSREDLGPPKQFNALPSPDINKIDAEWTDLAHLSLAQLISEMKPFQVSELAGEEHTWQLIKDKFDLRTTFGTPPTVLALQDMADSLLAAFRVRFHLFN